MGEAGESPALSRNCNQGAPLRARIPASAVLQTPSRERGQERWRGLAGRGGFFTGRSRPPPSRGPDPGSIFQTLVAETRAFYFPEDQEGNNERTWIEAQEGEGRLVGRPVRLHVGRPGG